MKSMPSYTKRVIESARVDGSQAGEPLRHRIHARVDGGIAYVCPECGRLNFVSRLNWRWPTHKCADCSCRWQVGLTFRRSSVPIRPHAGWVSVKEKGQYTINSFEPPTSIGEPLICGVTGSVQWSCPQCTHVTLGRPVRGLVACKKCALLLAVGIHLWKMVQGMRARVADDWTFGWKFNHVWEEANNRYTEFGAAPGRPRRNPARTESALRGISAPPTSDEWLYGDGAGDDALSAGAGDGRDGSGRVDQSDDGRE